MSGSHCGSCEKTLGENSNPIAQANGAGSWHEIPVKETGLQLFSTRKGSQTCDLKEVNLKA